MMNRKTKLAVGITVGLALLVAVAVALIVVFVRHSKQKTHNRDQSRPSSDLKALRQTLGQTSADPKKVDFGVPMYYINLDRSVARRRRFEAQLKEYDTKATRIPAVDGREIKLSVSNSDGSGAYIFNGSKRDVSIRGYVKPPTDKLPYPGHVWPVPPKLPFTYGELGCTLSHLHAIKTAYDAGDSVALFLEDDVTFELVPFWPQSLHEIIEHAPKDWEVLNLASTRTCTGQGYAPRNSGDFGAQAYLVHRRGMKRLVDIVFASAEETRLWRSSSDDDTLLSADWFLYCKTKTYTFLTFAPFVFYNDTDAHESTIHPTHTRSHLDKRKRYIQCMKERGRLPDVKKLMIVPSQFVDGRFVAEFLSEWCDHLRGLGWVVRDMDSVVKTNDPVSDLNRAVDCVPPIVAMFIMKQVHSSLWSKAFQTGKLPFRSIFVIEDHCTHEDIKGLEEVGVYCDSIVARCKDSTVDLLARKGLCHDHVESLPHGVASAFCDSTLTVPSTAKLPKALLSGAIFRDYPLRVAAKKLDSSLIATRHHPGYQNVDGKAESKSYAKDIAKHLIAIAGVRFPESKHYLVAKHFEIPAAGTLMLTDRAATKELAQLGLFENRHFITATPETLADVLTYWLDPSRRSLVDRMVTEAQRLVRQHHRVRNRAIQFDNMCKTSSNTK